MIDLSYAIEDHAATQPEVTLIACFQRLTLFRPQIPRYQAIAERLANTYVLGVPDVSLSAPPGITVLSLAQEWPLVQEWCVIASGPTCAVALLARDYDGFRPDRRSKQFEGCWTTDTAIVDQLLIAFHRACGRPGPSLARDARALLESTRAIQRALKA
jgi:DICT domain-containing protein